MTLVGPTRANPDSGGRGGGGGTTSGSGGGTSNPSNPALLPLTGGISGATGQVVLPGVDNNGQMSMLTFDTSTFNSERDALLRFKTEDTNGVQCTIKRILFQYRNLGICTFQYWIEGLYRNSEIKTVKIGDPGVPVGTKLGVRAIGDGKIYRAYLDILFTDENPTLVIYRPANAGPLSIVSIVLAGDEFQTGAQ